MIVRSARTPSDLAAVQTLIAEYVAGIGQDRFQGLHAGAALLPTGCTPPGGTLLLACTPHGRPVGCVGVRPLALAGTCEMKRLYVRPEIRGAGLGRILVEHALAFAATAGYARLLLDTMPEMTGAQSLYRALGFTEVAPYQPAVEPGLLFFAKALDPAPP